jgi:hypothetical protein
VPTSPKLRHREDGGEQWIVPQAASPGPYDRQFAVVPASDTEGIRRQARGVLRGHALQRINTADLPDFMREPPPDLPNGSLPVRRMVIAEVPPAPDVQPTLPPERMLPPVAKEWQPILTKVVPSFIEAVDIIADLPTDSGDSIKQAMAQLPPEFSQEDFENAPTVRPTNPDAWLVAPAPVSTPAVDTWEYFREQESVPSLTLQPIGSGEIAAVDKTAKSSDMAQGQTAALTQLTELAAQPVRDDTVEVPAHTAQRAKEMMQKLQEREE